MGFSPSCVPSLLTVTKLTKALAALTPHQPSEENTPQGEQGSFPVFSWTRMTRYSLLSHSFFSSPKTQNFISNSRNYM